MVIFQVDMLHRTHVCFLPYLDGSANGNIPSWPGSPLDLEDSRTIGVSFLRDFSYEICTIHGISGTSGVAAASSYLERQCTP